ncbi:FkbM family methyltransferase [Methylobacterium sp. WL7]|uniref:FkbM family methyltransferase n=1 Tax=Methylobacterium sp. WL7 TaxID=2603900 RepID=UPI00164EFC2A|nr:FkbM family methyltransferase [Methylobacterium sp. WL7]
MRRRLTKWDSIQTLLRAGLNVGTVIDVGVQRDSPDLRQLFSSVPHILFEPVLEYHEDIHRAYAGVNYKLEPVALSDRYGPFLLREVRADADGVVSHVSPAEGHEASLRTVQRKTLDGYVDETSPAKPYLIKIDVDGHETEILKGARRALFDASCVIVETTLHHLPERLRLAEVAGLALWDIVDMTYYDGCLYQCDLVFIPDRADGLIRRLDPRMRIAFEAFDPAVWYSLHASAEDDV